MSELELLFFDTFSHESSEEINLDLVQFPKPIFIGEVRIIPLGARVQADFPGGVRLGATNPSQFKIEFFVNDLSKPGAPTFEHLGCIEYNQNGNIHLECENSHIPTDGLVLYGWYTTITLAVYGVLNKSIQPDTSNQPDMVTAEWLQRHHHQEEAGGYLMEGGGLAPHHYASYPQDDEPVGGNSGGGSVSGTGPGAASTGAGQGYQQYDRHGTSWHQSCHAESYDASKESYETEGWSEMPDNKTWERDKVRHQDQFRYERRLDSVIDRGDPSANSQQDVGTPEYDSTPTSATRSRQQDYYQTSNTVARWSAGSGNTWEPPRKRPHTPPPPTPSPTCQTVPQQQPPQPPLPQLQQEQQQPPQLSQRAEQETSPGVNTSGTGGGIDLSPGDVESISEGDIPETEAGEDISGTNNGLAIEVSIGVGAKTPPTPPQPTSPLLNTAGGESPLHGAGNDSANDKGSTVTVQQEAFEPILSDDELPDDQFQDLDYDFTEYTEDPLKSFNPYNNEIVLLKGFEDPASSLYDPSGRRDEVSSAAEVEALNNLVIALPEDSKTGREIWVETVEQIISCLPKSLVHLDSSNKEVVVTRIIECVLFGLNFSEALSQPQPGLKIRHIKAGIRLVEALSCSGEEICMKMLENTNAQNLLLDIYHEQYMALVIKLMVLRSLDSTLRYKPCIERFIEMNKKTGQSGYQRLLEMVQGNQHARIKFALCSILQKLHFFELLLKLSTSVSQLEASTKGVKIEEEFDKEDLKVDSEFISMTLEQILHVYMHAPTMISQPKRILPVSARFEINSSAFPDPYKAIYTYFRFSNLLRTFITLLSHPGTSCCLAIVAPINSLVSELLESDDGMKFLASSEEVNRIIRLLLGSSAKVEENQMGSLGVNPTLGLHLAYRLQALSYLDSINSIPNADPDKPEVLDHLQGLYTLTLSNIGNIGKSSVVHVLSQGDNINILLKILKNKCTTKKRSPSRGYICDLILLCVKLTSHVPFLQIYCETLIELSKTNFPELAEVQKWLRPIEISSMGDIGRISDIIKNNIDVCTSLPGELITAVRLLRYMGIPRNENDLSPVARNCDYRELKYKCVILDFYSLDGLSHLISILNKLNKYHEYPHLYSSRLIARQGLQLLSFILPAVQLMRRMLTYVIRCRNTNFKDLTAVPILLQTYNFMQAIPLNAQAHTDAVRVCREIIETLLAYTQPFSSETCSENEALNKSLWTSMVSEIIKFTTDLPINFASGLMIISELLPLPLPLQTKDPLTEDETARFINSRKLWSAHLHSLSPLLENMISTMSISSCQPLLQLLRRVCIQLADLAAPTALTVVKTVLDTLATQFSTNIPKDLQLTRILKFLTCLVTHSAVKAAFLSLIKSEKYHLVFLQMLDSFRMHSDVDQNDECLASILQYLIDTEISLVPPPGHHCSVTAESFLANTLPSKDVLVSICSAMLEHISTEHSFSVSLLVIRTFLLLVEHDYGFLTLKSCLEKNGDSLYNLLIQIGTKFQSDLQLTLAILSNGLELLRALTSCEPVEGYNLNRTNLLTPLELASLLKWPQTDHPLILIEDHLKKAAAMDEDKTSERLLEAVTSLIKLLEDDSSANNSSVASTLSTSVGETAAVSQNIKDSSNTESLQLPQPETLLGQFALRTVSILVDGEDDTVLSTAYWLAPPKCDDQETDPGEQISMDLMEIAKNELGGLCLQDAVVELCQHKDSNKINDSLSNAKSKTNEISQRKLFIAPMRGRGAYRGVNSMSSAISVANSGASNVAGGPRGDMFRSRPPNTSRPPSLHVDDFVALETCVGGGGGLVAPQQGYQPQILTHESVIQDKINRVRGRGRSFGMDRGRFFGTHPYHRDTGDAWERIGHHMYSSDIGIGNDPGSGIVPRFVGGIGRIQRSIMNSATVWTKEGAVLRGLAQQQQQQAPTQPQQQQSQLGSGGVIVGSGRHMRFFNR